MGPLNVCPFDYTTFEVSGKVRIPKTGLTTSVGWLSGPELIVLSRFAITVQSKFLVAFCVVALLFGFSVGVGAFVIGLSQISSFFSKEKEVKDVFGRLGARVGVGAIRKRPLDANDVGCPAAGLTLETGKLSRHYIA